MTSFQQAVRGADSNLHAHLYHFPSPIGSGTCVLADKAAVEQRGMRAKHKRNEGNQQQKGCSTAQSVLHSPAAALTHCVFHC